MRVFERIRDWARGFSDDDLRGAYEKLAYPIMSWESHFDEGHCITAVALTKRETRAVRKCPRVYTASSLAGESFVRFAP